MKHIFAVILMMTFNFMGCAQDGEKFTNGASDMKMKIIVGNTVLTATLVENSSTQALMELLNAGSITINMSDYGNFEKVGDLRTTLPRNDVRITTVPGDLILYQGNSFVIYYAPNTWSLTRLGKIDNVTQDELRNILGTGNVTVTLEATN